MARTQKQNESKLKNRIAQCRKKIGRAEHSMETEIKYWKMETRKLKQESLAAQTSKESNKRWNQSKRLAILQDDG